MGSTNTGNTTPQCSVTLLTFSRDCSGSAVGKMYPGCYEENKYKGKTTKESTSFFMALIGNRRSCILQKQIKWHLLKAEYFFPKFSSPEQLHSVFVVFHSAAQGKELSLVSLQLTEQEN